MMGDRKSFSELLNLHDVDCYINNNQIVIGIGNKENERRFLIKAVTDDKHENAKLATYLRVEEL